jgi:hypothetical protein
MKKVFRNVVAACAAVALMSAFASCSSDSSDDNDAAKIVAQQQAAQKAEAEAKAKKEAEEKAAAETQTQTPAATQSTTFEVWTGSQAIDWGDKGVVIDHAKFTENFTAIRVTYNATAGAVKLAVCDPWTEITPASVSAGTLAADGALELPTGDAKTVTINLNEAAVAGIKGQGKDGAWGGVKLYGADTITITKVEAVKAAASTTTPATTTPETQTQTPAATTTTATEVFSGSKTIDWGDNGVVIDHAKFTADFTSIRITYNATAGALKMAVCDPWTEITPASVSEGASIAADGAVNLVTGDAKTVTIKLADAAVSGIKGQGKDGAWGGVKIFGADTITITKVESLKE